MQLLVALIAAITTLLASFFSGGEISGSTGGNLKVSYRDISTIEEIRSPGLDCDAVISPWLMAHASPLTHCR